MPVYDVAVVGVGGMGSATVYRLARRGVRVLGLEQFDIPHDRGSSHGVNRIIRLAYWEHPSYVPLLRRAYELWREIEHMSGDRLLVITGGVDAGPPESATIRGSLRSCELHHLPHEVLDARALERRFPGYRLPEEMVAVFQPDGGFVLSDAAITAYVMAAQSLGAEVHAREPVVSWEPEGGRIAIRTERGAYRARHMILTAGAWTSRIVPQLARLAAPERQVLIWTHPLRPDRFRLHSFPVFNMEAPEGRFYGFPVYQVPGFKLGKYHHRLQAADPDRLDRDVHLEDEEVLRDGIRKYFPDADGPTMAMKVCMFTNTPDEHFILDRLPEWPNVSVAAGFSGHGFKFASVVGEIMADLALDGGSRFDLSLFRLGRFAARA